MRPPLLAASSLRLRLFVGGAAAVVAALALAAAGLTWLFENHVERRAAAELSLHLEQVVAGLERGADGSLALARRPSDPRFARPLSGLYWQIDAPSGRLRSRSLWDGALSLPPDELSDGAAHQHRIAGPNGGEVLVVERLVTLPPRLDAEAVRVAVALDRAELQAASRAFLGDLAPFLALLALALTGAGWAQVAVGLRPLAAVGARVAAIRSGAAARLGTDFPDEVRPLAAEVDALIDARERDVARARARAADLAHGLKTPLQALNGEAARLRAAGEAAAATGIEQIADAMRRHVDRELSRARMATGDRAAATDVAAVIERVLSVLRRTPDGARLAWRVEAAPGLRARVNAADLTEALGALIENAARHADAAVTITAQSAGERVTLTIRDDGPGIPPERLAEATGRGARLDETRPGHGLGLSIATEIAANAGGALALRNAAPGLEATLTLPAAAPGGR